MTRGDALDADPAFLLGCVAAAVCVSIGAWWLLGEVNEPDAGTVTETYHEPEYYDYEDGIWYDDTYEVWYEDAEGNEGDDMISRELFEALEVGDDYWKGMKPGDVD